MKKLNYDKIQREVLDEIATSIPPCSGVPFTDWKDFMSRHRHGREVIAVNIECAVVVTLRHINRALEDKKARK